MDGDIGFEPMNTGTKSQGLTTWRIPIMIVNKSKITLVAETGFEPVTFGL